MGNLCARSLSFDGDESGYPPSQREKLSHTRTDVDRKGFLSGTTTVFKCSVMAGITAIFILAFYGAIVYVDRNLHPPQITVSNSSDLRALEPYADMRSVHVDITFYMIAKSEVSPRFRFSPGNLTLMLWLNDTSVFPLRNINTEEFEVGHTGPSLFKAYCNESHDDPAEIVSRFKFQLDSRQLQLVVKGRLRTRYRASRLVSNVYKHVSICQRLQIDGPDEEPLAIQKIEDCPDWLKQGRYKVTAIPG